MVTALMLLFCGCQSEPDPDAIDSSTAPTLPVEEITELPTLALQEDGTDRKVVYRPDNSL